MGVMNPWPRILFFFFIALSACYQSCADETEADQPIALYVNASEASAKKIPKTLFGIFFEVRSIKVCDSTEAS